MSLVSVRIFFGKGQWTFNMDNRFSIRTMNEFFIFLAYTLPLATPRKVDQNSSEAKEECILFNIINYA